MPAFSTLALSCFLSPLPIYSLSEHLLLLTPARAVQLCSHCPDSPLKPQHSPWLLTQPGPSGPPGWYNSRDKCRFPELWYLGLGWGEGRACWEVMPVLHCDWGQQLATRRGRVGHSRPREQRSKERFPGFPILQRAGLGGCHLGEAVGTKAGKALPAGVLPAMLVKVPAAC